jgi:glycosyltransferase involved in cell wall biosynthesis
MSVPTMRIAVDASSLLTRHPRGEGKSLLRLYEEIAHIRPKWSFIFFGTRTTHSASQILDRIPRCEIRTFELPGFRWNLWENLGLPMAAWRSGANLLHCASSGAPVWSPLPVVMTVHDVIPLIMDDGMDGNGVKRFRNRLSAGLRQSRSVIAVSEHTRTDLARIMKTDPDKIKVVPWGADSNPQDMAGDRPATDLILGFGGGGSVRKNTPAMVRMFSKVAANHPTARLAILGVTDDTQRQQLQKLIDELALQGRVSLMGFVSEAELEKFYREAICLVYISLYEGFGLPPLEVMVHGVPVVASNRSSIPEVVGDSGILVDPENIDEIADAVLSLLDNQALHRQLSEKSWQRAREFSWRNTAEKTVSIFEAALDQQHS